MFSSREAFSDDPEPYVMWLRDGFKAHPVKRFPSLDDARAELEQYGGSPGGGEIQFDFRPECDRPQNSPTNPILVEFRRAACNYASAGLEPHHAVRHYLQYLDGDVYGWSENHKDHARRVLSRWLACRGVSL